MTATAPTKKPSIWSLTVDQMAALDLLDELDGGEMTTEQEAAFDAIFAELDTNVVEVVDRLAGFRANLKARASVEQSRKEEHAKRQKALENAAERIGNRIKDFGVTTQRLTLTEGKTPGKKIETGEWIVSIQRNGGVQPMKFVEGERVPEAYCKMVPDDEQIRTALEQGAKLGFAILEERGFHVRFK